MHFIIQERMSTETYEKRGRGRPKGSLNKKTEAKQEQMRRATMLDVSFESPTENEIIPLQLDEGKPVSPAQREGVAEEEEAERVSMVEPEEPEEPVSMIDPKPKRKPKKSNVPEVMPERYQGMRKKLHHLHLSEK